jgi:uncharacterized SAM-binding protein YcdF (DUF218 family)
MFAVVPLWSRLLGSVLSGVLLLLFLNSFFLGIRNIGAVAGTVMSVAGLLFFAANPFVSRVLQKIWANGAGHVVLCICIGLLCLFAVLALFISGCMVRAANHGPVSENTVVVLGCKVKNGEPSLMLRRRLDAACRYLTDHPDVPVIVCGGQGEDESISEAQCMYDYLVANGIAAERIYQDSTSVSTRENLQNAKEISEENGWGSEITIVTDGYHQFRASMIAKSLSLEAYAVSAYTSWYLLPTYWVREWLGICYQAVLG